MRYDLYINGQLCDLSDDSLIVLTYTLEQLNNPTAVKNTYSHEVSLPSTEANDQIFSHFYRNDYRTSGNTFSPLSRVPFEIYSELGEIVEGGYIKLDEITIDQRTHTYKVVLYGGLGSFFDVIANENGEALSLGDLNYMSSASDEQMLNLRIDRATVGGDGAWGRLNRDNLRYQFDVVNFAPTYQGKPSGDFDASKAVFVSIARASSPGVYTDTLISPIYGVNAVNGTNKMYKRFKNGVDTGYRISLVDLGEEHTEWETKDLRSYLQRPVLSIRKFVEAVQRRAIKKGYTLNLDSAFFNDDNPYYNKAWITLPSLQSFTKPSKTVSAELSAKFHMESVATETIPITVTAPTATNGFEFGATIENAKATIPELEIGFTLGKDAVRLANGGNSNAWFLQIVGRNEPNNIVASSNVIVLADRDETLSVGEIVSRAGYIPVGGDPTYTLLRGVFSPNSATTAIFSHNNLTFDINGSGNPASWELQIDRRGYKRVDSEVEATMLATALQFVDIEGNVVVQNHWGYIDAYNLSYLNGTTTISANTNVRSGVVLSKRELFDIGKTPLDVLLGYCKLFGLLWHYEVDSNVVYLEMRQTFYGEGTTLDLSDRIDHNREMTIKPFEFDKRFYDFELETIGEFAEEYKEKYGATYGAQRVNTGYRFDNEAKNLLEGNALRGCAEVLEQGKYFVNIEQDGKICPAVFLDGGKYQLYNSNGEPVEYDIVTPGNTATIDYMHDTLQGYDAQPKAQMHSGTSVDEAGGVLLLYDGNIEINSTSPYRNYLLTDDVAEMGLLNDGQLCWVLEGSYYGMLDGETIPKFVRTGLNVSLDMGIPQEIDNPNPDTEAVQNSIFSQYWRDYLADRYDQDSRVLTCYVDLRGLQVGNALFRNFYYFDGAIWALNKINNYSMTTIGTTQCEFVKVQDVKNYKGE